MRAFVIPRGLSIEPFGDSAASLPVGGVPLSEWQTRQLRRFGLEVVLVDSIADVPTDEPRIVTYDNVFFTRRVLKSLLRRWKAGGHRPSRVALPIDSTLIDTVHDLQDFDSDGPHALFDLFALPAGASNDLRTVAEPLPVIFKEKVLRLPVPTTVTGMEHWVHPVTSSVCMHLRHWLHFLQANLLTIQIRWVDEIITHPLWASWVLLRGLMPGRGRLAWRIGASANRIGKNVDIHPTARVEGCFIGDNVTVGPMALVRGSIIGAGSTLQERVNVTFSVIGDGSFVSKHSIVYACAGFEAAELCMKGMQLCLVGRRAALTARATPIDVTPGRKLRVKDGGELKEIDVPILGSCYGHDAFIGADVFVGPGRAIPNGVRVVIQPERVLSRIPDDVKPGQAYVVRNGRLDTP